LKDDMRISCYSTRNRIHSHWEENIWFKYTHFKYLPTKDQAITIKVLNNNFLDTSQCTLIQTGTSQSAINSHVKQIKEKTT